MTEALGLSIEYVNWMDSELHAIECRVDNDAELASVVHKLVCQSRDEADATLGELFDCGPIRIALANVQIFRIVGRVEEGLLGFEPTFFDQLEALGKIRFGTEPTSYKLIRNNQCRLDRFGSYAEDRMMSAVRPLHPAPLTNAEASLNAALGQELTCSVRVGRLPQTRDDRRVNQRPLDCRV